jgi:hypothetical protein
MNKPSPPPSPLRIAILECDIPIGNTREKYGGYGNLFKELLLKGKDEVREGKDGKEGVDLPELDVTKYNVVDEELYPKLEEVDVVLVSGSRESLLPSHFLLLGTGLVGRRGTLRFDETHQSNRSMLCVRALANESSSPPMQVLTPSTTISGSLNSSILSRECSSSRRGCGWSGFVSAIRSSAALLGRKLVSFFFLVLPSHLPVLLVVFPPHHAYAILPSQAIHQMHQDAVYTYPPSVEHLGHSPSCHVQGMYERKRLITTQGHPEFDEDIVAELLENRHDRGVFDDGTYEDAMRRVKKHHDGVRVAGAFLRFMVEE